MVSAGSAMGKVDLPETNSCHSNLTAKQLRG